MAKGETGVKPKSAKAMYADGHPLDEVKYLECKLILKGDRFTSESNFDDFGKVVKRAAEAADVSFSRKPFKGARPQIREVLFLDTADFRREIPNSLMASERSP